MSEIKGLIVDLNLVQTNILFVQLGNLDLKFIIGFLRKKGIVVPESTTMRLITHLDVLGDDVKRVIEVFQEAVSRRVSGQADRSQLRRSQVVTY